MDKIEMYNNALIQHGSYNNRLYVMKFPETGDRSLVKKLSLKAAQNGYAKIVAKVPKKRLTLFLTSGFKVETTIPKFYNGQEDCCFMSKFLDTERATFNPEPLNKFKEAYQEYQYKYEPLNVEGVEVKALGPDNAEEIASIYRSVFETYPFPVFEQDYILQTMQNDVLYFGAYVKGRLQCVSSSELDVKAQNAEMTDFAALHEARGKGLSKILLAEMEHQMKERNIKTLYTIARLNSLPMNKTFMGAGYSYAGTLINNTNISGSIESMNIWYKFI